MCKDRHYAQRSNLTSNLKPNDWDSLQYHQKSSPHRTDLTLQQPRWQLPPTFSLGTWSQQLVITVYMSSHHNCKRNETRPNMTKPCIYIYIKLVVMYLQRKQLSRFNRKIRGSGYRDIWPQVWLTCTIMIIMLFKTPTTLWTTQKHILPAVEQTCSTILKNISKNHC